MTTEQTITVHHEPPTDTMYGDKLIMAYYPHEGRYKVRTAHEVRAYWATDYTAWYDPQIGEPVKPRRYVVEKSVFQNGTYVVRLTAADRVVADNIPTREAAEAIADIYERAAEGGEG